MCKENGHVSTMCPTVDELRAMCGRKRHKKANMSADQIQRQRSQRQVANMSEDQIQRQRSQRQIANMSDDQIQSEQSRHQLSNMSDDHIQRQRSQRQVANMSQVQIDQQRFRGTHGFVPLQQVWDDDNPCQYCCAIFLKSVSKSARKKCCNNGAYLMADSEFPKLEMLPEALKYLCLERGEHFGKQSAKYNNILSIGSNLLVWRIRKAVVLSILSEILL
jgi:hypothetical protein